MLKPRLQAIFEQIKNANYVVDIGSDHAHLSIALIKQNKCNYVTNIEINQKPLENGYNNVKKHNLLDKINFYLNDGLKDIDLGKEIDFLCISGMGSDSIIDILRNNKLNKVNNYILQANCDVYKLRKFLIEHNFLFINELIVYENNKYYEILVVKLSNSNNYNELYDYYIGPVFKNNDSLLFLNFIKNKAKYLNSILNNKISYDIKQEAKVLNKFLYEKKWIN